MKLIEADGTVAAQYTYNAWGEILTSSGTMSEINPLRYRGYYYDTETGFYYLQSRYYDPAMHRFINADSLASTGQGIVGTNMFAYCNNSPVVFKDPNGEDAIAITITVTAAGLVVITITVAGIVIAVYELVELTCEALEWLWSLAEKLGAKIFCNEVICIPAPLTKLPTESEEETKTNVAVIESVESKKAPVLFPENPLFFNPIGLILVQKPGTKNGRVYYWKDPITNVAIFRWDENINRSNGPHYHILDIANYNIHYYAKDLVPEPYATIYFPSLF